MIVKFIFGIHLSSPELMLVVFLFLVAGQKQSPFAGWIKGGKGKLTMYQNARLRKTKNLQPQGNLKCKRPRKSPQEVLE